VSDYLPPVVARLTADIDDFKRKFAEAKRIMRDFAKDQTAQLKVVQRDFTNLDKTAGRALSGMSDKAKNLNSNLRKLPADFDSIRRTTLTADEAFLKGNAAMDDYGRHLLALRRLLVQGGQDAGGLTGALRRVAAEEKALSNSGGGGGILSGFQKGWKGTKNDAAGNWFTRLMEKFGGGMKGMWGSAGGVGGYAGAGSATLAIAGGAAAMIGTLAAVVSALGGGLLAAGMGLGALGAVAMPTITALQGALTTLATATTNYQTASANLDTAIHKSPADWKLYQATIHGLEPDLQRAAKLLTNQDATWQSLSPSMRKSLTALRNNHDAYRALLPDQQKALNALLAQRDAWNSLTPAQQKAAVALQAVGKAWTKVTDAMQPIVLGLVAKGAKIASDAIPFVMPLAKAAAGAVGQLLTELDKFMTSKGFAAFMKQMAAIAGPAIVSLGHGLGAIVLALGKFFTVLGKKDTIMMFNGTIRVVTDTIVGLIIVLSKLAVLAQRSAQMMGHVGHDIASNFDFVRHAAAVMAAWVSGSFDKTRHAIMSVLHDLAHGFDQFRHQIASAWGAVERVIESAGAWIVGSIIKTGHSVESNWNHAWTVVVNYVKGVPGAILRALGNLGSLLVNAGKAIMDGFLSGIKSGWNDVTGFLGSVGGWISHLKGPLDYDRRLLVPHGMAIMNGLMDGMQSRMPALRSFLHGVTSTIGGSGAPVWSHGSHPFIPAPAHHSVNPNSGQFYGGPMVIESHVYIDGREVYKATQKQAVRTQKRTGSNGLQRTIR
jgi:hypothetical protein